MRWTRNIANIVLKAGALSLLWSSAAHGQARSKLQVGAILPLSGTMGSLGRQVLSGAELAIDDFIAANPSFAGQVFLHTEDDQAMANKAEEAVKKLNQTHRVNVYFGSLTGPATMAIAREAATLNRPMLSPVATDNLIGLQGTMVYRTCSVDRYQGITLARFALEKLKKSRAAILVNRLSQYSKSIAEGFSKAYQRHKGQIVATEEYEPGTTDFYKLMRQVRKHKPEVVVVPTYYQEAAAIITAAKKAGLRAVYLGPDGWDSPQMPTLLPKSGLSKLYYATPFSEAVRDPQVTNFVTNFQKKHGSTPSLFAAHGYDGMMVILDSFKRAKGNLAKPLSAAMGNTKGLNGVMGSMLMSRQRNIIKPFALMSLSSNGVKFFTIVSPAS